MARKSFFHYFDIVDRDDSGLIEQNEVEYLARLLFGEDREAEIKAYVKGVFDKFDDNHSGALSFSGTNWESLIFKSHENYII